MKTYFELIAWQTNDDGVEREAVLWISKDYLECLTKWAEVRGTFTPDNWCNSEFDILERAAGY